MKEIKINFVDFWPGFDKTNNYFYNLLVQKYKVTIDENPDLLFYSSYNNDYLKYNCHRIFYTAENIRPDFLACDFAFSFDYNKRKNHFRLPLYSMYVELLGMLDKLETIKTREEARSIWRAKTKFCCMVISNPNSSKRLEFFDTLSKVKPVDSGGSVFNNVGGRVTNKAEFIKDYKFVLSFENSAYDGYTTEKIMEPIHADCIPIYWGNKLVDRDFNAGRFLDYNKFASEKELIDRILEIDQNEELAIDILMQPTFSLDRLAHTMERQQVLQILDTIIEHPGKPIARQWLRYIHKAKLLYEKNKKRIAIKFKLT
ncbi:MAG: glycosyltransferase [Flavobacterium sp.]|nr:glycosyltransferase [Flavobacterium sp.]